MSRRVQRPSIPSIPSIPLGAPRSRLPSMEDGSMTGFLLGLQTLKQRQAEARSELAEVVAKARVLQRDLQKMKMQEARFRKVLSVSQAQQAQQKMRDRAFEKAKRAREVAEERKKNIETARFQNIVSELLTDVRYDTGNRKAKRAIRRMRNFKRQKK